MVRTEREVIMLDYSQFRIRDYEYWTLYLHSNQCYLGRSYVWLRRPGEMQRLSDLAQKERYELWNFILAGYEAALDRLLWRPDHMNYAWLGNEFSVHQGHGCMHLIPRYKCPVLFAGLEFCDNQWGENYAPYPKTKLSQIVLFDIRDALRKELA